MQKFGGFLKNCHHNTFELATSCSDNDKGKSKSIEFTLIGQGGLSRSRSEGILQSNMVITNSSDWELLLDKIYLIEVDNIDFSRHMVIAVFLGRISSGSEAYIQHIIENKDDITVEICHSHSVTTDAFSDSPFHVVKVPITGKPIVFEYIIEPIPL